MDTSNNELSRLASAVFGGERFDRLEADRELELIELVQAGDSQAFWDLSLGYASALRGLMKGFRSEHSLGLKEAQEELLQGFAEQVIAYDLTDTSKRLAYSIRRVRDRLSEVRTAQALPVVVPEASMYRLRKHAAANDGDRTAMLNNVARSGFHIETLTKLMEWQYRAVVEPEDITVTAYPTDGSYIDFQEYSDLAFAAIDDEPESVEIMRLKHWFDDPERSQDVKLDRSDYDVGQIIGCSSRKVGKVRAKALETMREALGVERQESAA